MDLADYIIILLLIATFIRGKISGFIRQLFSTAGFFGGLFLGVWIGPHFVKLAHTPLSRAWLGIGITMGSALVILSVGEYVGAILKQKIRYKRLDQIDGWLGSLIGAVTLLAFVWLGAAAMISLPYTGIQNQIRGSYIISELDRHLPPTPDIIDSLGHIISPNGFPTVFNNGEPPLSNNVALPNMGILTAAVNKDEASVVKIEGYGCGGIVEGSGFVAAPGLVITNAHVVAGVAHPYVMDSNGQHSTTVIWFDPNLDLAVLEVSNLAGSTLNLDQSIVTNGTATAILGYPGGGSFTARPGVIMDEFTAIGQNIYGQANTTRNVYELKGEVIPGNSGGPLINQKGAVVGVVFAESTEYNQVGYALAMQKVVSELHQAESSRTVRSTGQCAE